MHNPSYIVVSHTSMPARFRLLQEPLYVNAPSRHPAQPMYVNTAEVASAGAGAVHGAVPPPLPARRTSSATSAGGGADQGTDSDRIIYASIQTPTSVQTPSRQQSTHDPDVMYSMPVRRERGETGDDQCTYAVLEQHRDPESEPTPPPLQPREYRRSSLGLFSHASWIVSS